MALLLPLPSLAAAALRVAGSAGVLLASLNAAEHGEGDGTSIVVSSAAGEALQAQEGRLFLTAGEEAMRTEEWAQAASAFAAARRALPPTAQELMAREQALHGWISASLARSRQLALAGRRQEANEVLAQLALDPEAGMDPRLTQAVQELASAPADAAGNLFSFALVDDGEDKNPPRGAEGSAAAPAEVEAVEEGEITAVTEEHLREVAEVSDYLRLAESQVRIGLLDEAEETYHRALAVDQYNQAARRGLEWVGRERSKYYRDSYNATRSALISEVAGGWETPVPLDQARALEAGQAAGADLAGPGASLRAQMAALRIEQIDVMEAPLQEVLTQLRMDAEAQGLAVNFVWVDNGLERQEPVVTLKLDQVPLTDLLDLVASTSNTSWSVERGAVVFRSGSGDQIYTEIYTVPPALLQQVTLSAAPQAGAAGAGGVFGGGGPFGGGGTFGGAATPAAGTAKLGVQQILEAEGIVFGEGASARYNRGQSQLILTNTTSQHQQMRELLDAVRSVGLKQVRVDVKVIKVANISGSELSFDTLLGAANLGSERLFGSGGSAAGSSGDQGGREFPLVYPGGGATPVGTNLISGGLRSGLQALSSDSIDGLIADTAGRAQSSQLESPGIFSLGGVFTDPQFQLLMRGFSQNSANDFIAVPSVTGQSGQQMRMTQVREIIYAGEWDPPELPNNLGGDDEGDGTTVRRRGIRRPVNALGGFPVTPAHPTGWKTDFEGVVLEVLPTVSDDGSLVTLDLNPKFRVFEGFINYGTPILAPQVSPLGMIQTGVVTENRILQPVFREYDLRTQVNLYDGQTFLLGGLLQDEVESFVDKVPLLGDMPLLGRLFQSRGQSRSRDAIVFMVTVQVLDANGRPLKQ